MAPKHDLYKLLGVSRSASQEEIKKAYRNQARKYHPDMNPNDQAAEQRFKDISRAHDVLSDPKKRKMYDEFGDDSLRQNFDPERARAYQQWAGGFRQSGPFAGFGGSNAGGPGVDFDFEEIFSSVFENGGGPDLRSGGPRGARRTSHRMKGPDAHTRIEIDVLEAIRGVEKQLTLSGGPGANPRNVRVRIPAGVEDGGKVRLKGQGSPSPLGGPPGDLVMTVSVLPHPKLRRRGIDLELDVPITVGEAFRGARVAVPTPDGEVTVTIPAGTRSGARLRLKGRGVGRKGRSRGDFYAVVQIQLPDPGDSRAREAIEVLESAYSRGVREDLKL